MMMASDFIIDVSEADFEYEVVAYSQQVPVVVDFWAEWCGPCKVLGPMLERLAKEAEGSFRLAKVNVDENPNLAKQFAIRSIPAVKAFQDGRMVAEFAGAQPEPKLREFLRSISPSEGNLNLEKAYGLLAMQKAESAEDVFRQVLNESPESAPALLGLSKSILLQGRGSESQYLLRSFPASQEYARAETLRPLAEALASYEKNGSRDSDSPLDAAFNNALRLVKRGNFEAALDGLLDILRQDKRFRSGLARQVFVAILELLGDENPLTRQYRSELAMVLF